MPTLWLCKSATKLRKNVIGGAIGEDVFKHKKSAHLNLMLFGSRNDVGIGGEWERQRYTAINEKIG